MSPLLLVSRIYWFKCKLLTQDLDSLSLGRDFLFLFSDWYFLFCTRRESLSKHLSPCSSRVCPLWREALFPDWKGTRLRGSTRGKLGLSLPSVQVLAGIYLRSCPTSQTPSWCLPEDLSCKTSGKIPAAASTLQKMWFVDRHSCPLSELWANKKSVARQQPSEAYYFCYAFVILILYLQVLTLHRYLFKS